MRCLIGLGNPGSQYDGTRHNIGFDIVEEVARTARLRFVPGKGDYLYAQGSLEQIPFLLVKPLTYMNESGSAVTEVLEHFRLSPDDLLVVCDDFQLPLGQLRLRLKGSDGGHNGLYSIIYHLQSDLFPRLRCGIASSFTPTDKARMARYVLEPFAREESANVKKMIRRGSDACCTVLTEGLTQAMNQFNSKPE